MSSCSIIPELSFLLHLVEEHYGRSLSTTTDFESLSVIIERETGELLSSSTLKRLYGYVSMKPVPRKSTLDILARFIGERSYEDFRRQLKTNPMFNSRFFSAKIVYSSDLAEGSTIEIGWNPDRLVTLRYRGGGLFEVIKSENSQLMQGDRFEEECFMMGYPLYVARILRNGEYTSAYVAGINGGLNLINVL
jgi:hypothetical protein